MFAVAFPLAPLLAYLNNVVEYRSDFSKLCAARRPPAQIRYCLLRTGTALFVSLFICDVGMWPQA
jgi:hypothetical protein